MTDYAIWWGHLILLDALSARSAFPFSADCPVKKIWWYGVNTYGLGAMLQAYLRSLSLFLEHVSQVTSKDAKAGKMMRDIRRLQFFSFDLLPPGTGSNFVRESFVGASWSFERTGGRMPECGVPRWRTPTLEKAYQPLRKRCGWGRLRIWILLSASSMPHHFKSKLVSKAVNLSVTLSPGWAGYSGGGRQMPAVSNQKWCFRKPSS